MNTILLSIIAFFSVFSSIVGSLALYIGWSRGAAFKTQHDYMIRMEKYAEGIADIHGGLKETIQDHHSAMVEVVSETKKEILDKLGYTLRWGELLAKLIRVEGKSQMHNAKDHIEQAEQMHELGVEIVENAFDEKTALEKKEAAAVKEELATAKEELASSEPQAKPT